MLPFTEKDGSITVHTDKKRIRYFRNEGRIEIAAFHLNKHRKKVKNGNTIIIDKREVENCPELLEIIQVFINEVGNISPLGIYKEFIGRQDNHKNSCVELEK